MKKILVFILIPLNLISQIKNEINYALPVDVNISLSANFGELRSNHFHMGIDFRTNGEVGKNIITIEDGYVSRIRVLPYGYGNTLYITHPNGHVSVYAHLLKFNYKIESFIEKYQYSEKVNVVDMEPAPNELKVRKGEIIAFSGNTGSSQGPHLHFEIRDATTNIAINPLIYYPQIVDYIKPQIFNVFIYPLDDTSMVNGRNQRTTYRAVAISNGKYRINEQPQIYGNIGFAIQGQDRMTNSNNKFGYYGVKMHINDELHYHYQLDSISYDQTRYINSFADYGHFRLRRHWIQKAYVEPNNELQIYKYIVGDGSITTSSESSYNIKFEAFDFSGNTSEIQFSVQEKKWKLPKINNNYTAFFHYDTTTNWTNGILNISIPNTALYNNLKFNFEIDSSAEITSIISPVYKIHDEFTPLHSEIDFSIKSDTVSKNLINKLVIAKVKNNSIIGTIQGGYSNNTIYGKSIEFGNFALAVDTLPPTVRGLGIYNNINLSRVNKVRFTIRDNLSGIGIYNAYINGKWVILEYDQKYNLLSHTFNHKYYKKDSKNNFLLIVEDKVGNSTEYSFDFYK